MCFRWARQSWPVQFRFRTPATVHAAAWYVIAVHAGDVCECNDFGIETAVICFLECAFCDSVDVDEGLHEGFVVDLLKFRGPLTFDPHLGVHRFHGIAVMGEPSFAQE